MSVLTKLVFGLAWFALAAVEARAASAPIRIATRGAASGCTVVLPTNPGVSYVTAAEELRDYVRKTTGVTLAIVTNGVAGTVAKPTIRLEEIEAAERETDVFRLRAEDGSLRVVGGPRGILYGVYELLERYAGVRWYASWHEVAPARDAIEVPGDLAVEQRPAFLAREPYWWDVIRHPEFAARLRVNCLSFEFGPYPERLGGSAFRFGKKLPSAHTFFMLMPPSEFFATHPEYYSFFDGKRQSGRAQLCLSNPDVLRIVVERVKAAIREDPEAKFFGVSQNDWYGYCQCPACAAVDAEEGGPSGSIIRFVNAVAAEVEKEFPDKIIETLAYQYSRKAPAKTKVRKNVMPCFCSIELDFAYAMPASRNDQNAAFCREIAEWAAQTDMLYVWDYQTNFDYYPHAFPNVYTIPENIRFFRDSHVKAVFEQGACQGRHAEFAELKAWLTAKLLWNPDQEFRPLLDEFFPGYYGKAGPLVREYFERLQILQRSQPKRSLGIGQPPSQTVMDAAFLESASAMWERALDAVKDEPPVYGYNVRMGRLSTDYTRFLLHPEANDADPEQGARARRILDCVEEAGDICFCQNSGNARSFLERVWRCATATNTLPERSRLPEGYVALPYLRSSGREYIDTGYVPSSRSRVTIDFALNEGYRSGLVIPFGAGDTGQAGADKHFFPYFDGTWHAVVGSVWNGWTPPTDGENAYARQNMILNWAGSSWLDARRIMTTGQAFELPRTLSAYVFARHDATGPVCSAPMDLRALWIHEAGRLVREYVPAMKRDTKVCGLYEVCTGTFLVNTGEGRLLPPPDWREGTTITLVRGAAR